MKCPKCGSENPDNAQFCSMCYEPFRKQENAPAQPAGGPSAPAYAPVSSPPGGTGGLPGLPLVISVVLAIAAGGYYYYSKSSTGIKIDPGAPVEEKMAAADSIQESMEKELDKLVNYMQNRKPSKMDLQVTYGQKYTRIVMKHNDMINRLKLPCPTTCRSDYAYQAWSGKHEKRSAEAIEKYNDLVKKTIMEKAEEKYGK